MPTYLYQDAECEKKLVLKPESGLIMIEVASEKPGDRHVLLKKGDAYRLAIEIIQLVSPEDLTVGVTPDGKEISGLNFRKS